MKREDIIKLIEKDRTVSYTEKDGDILLKLSNSITLELKYDKFVVLNTIGLVPFEIEYAANYAMRFVEHPSNVIVVYSETTITGESISMKPVYETLETKIGICTGTITGKNFKIDSDGYATFAKDDTDLEVKGGFHADNAWLQGKIDLLPKDEDILTISPEVKEFLCKFLKDVK